MKNDPWIRIIAPEITPPTLRDNTADVDRLIRGIKKCLHIDEVVIDFSLLKRLPHALRQYDYRINAILHKVQTGWRLIDILSSQNDSCIYGLAVDLGSSTVVIQLVDLKSQKTIDKKSFHNPQIEIGTDILTRIHFAAKRGGLDKLQSLLMERLNENIDQLAKMHNIRTDSIVGISVAGNTTMAHFFLGMDPYWLCREPYIPVINKPEHIKSSDLGLAINPEAPVLVFPNVGSYFGGDLIAGILASGITHQDEVSFLVDVGTNAEVVIGNCDWLMGCAGAAGPALEGGVADMGMMAGPGVIDKVVIDPVSSEFKIRTIENDPTVGICGSGLIDLIAQLFLAGMIDLRGKYVAGKCNGRLVEVEGVKHLVVVTPANSGTGQALTLSQTDIDGIIRSKAAMYTILTTITNTVNISMNDINKFYIAGTFGSYIDPQSAITIGMMPDLPLETYIPLGNTSLKGAGMALVSAQAKDEIYRIRDNITYLELNVNQEFMNLFSAAKFIPHTDSALFPSAKTGGS
ncbi:MAG TPA: [Fe-S]-binding protein [Desulfobacteraceae bacterium]|nr:[Fe-S]-binding protein [Desulfobacteraceae bacterium]